jgi:hypothetical protein
VRGRIEALGLALGQLGLDWVRQISVLPGDTIATPPPGARPRIGIIASAQPEL